MQNYFELFSLEADFSIDLAVLEQIYQTQMAQHHPDKFATSNDKKKKLAMQNTSLINTAFNTLKTPLLRSTYLLELQGINAFDEKNTQMNAGFLMNQIELRESLEVLEVTKDERALDDFIENIAEKVKKNIEQIEQGFKSSRLGTIKNLVRELKFYTQLDAQANQLMDELL